MLNKLFTLSAFVVLIFLSCYFENDYGVSPKDATVKLAVENSLGIEIYHITISAPDMDTISFHKLAKDTTIAFFVPNGDNRVITMEGYAGGKKRYSATVSTGNLVSGEKIIPVCMQPVEIPLPGQPANLTLSFDKTINSVQLSWLPGDFADEYLIYRKKNDEISPLILLDSTSTSTYYDTTVSNGDTLLYQIVACNETGNSVPSSYATITLGYFNPPSVPQSVKASIASETSCQIKWNSVKGATQYHVYRTTDALAEPTLIAVEPDTVYMDKTITFGNSYFYTVTAENDAGESGKSILISALSSPLPESPQNVVATPQTEKSISVTWSESPNATKYQVFTSLSKEGMYTCIDTVEGLSFVHTNLSEGTAYYYKIAAVNFSGVSALSLMATATTGMRPLPSTPTNVIATTLSASSVKLTWSGVSVADEYIVIQNNVPIDTTSDTVYINTGLVPSTTYGYKVISKNTTGISTASVEVSATTSAPAQEKPGVPTGVVADTVSALSIRLEWQLVTGALYYKIYRNNDNSGVYGLIDSSSSNEFLDSSLSSNTSYYYVVTAVNNIGESGYSSMVSSTTSEIIDVPTDLSATAQSATSVGLSWSVVSGATKYNVYRSESSSGQFVCISNPVDNTYVDTGLTAGTTYYYKVSAFGVSVESVLCDAVSVTTSTPPPATPTGLSAEALSEEEIKVTFNSVSGALVYNIYVSSSAGGTFNKITSTSSTSYTHRNLETQTTYYYKVASSNASGESELSSAVSATTKAPPRTYYRILSRCNGCGRCYPCPNGAISNSSVPYVIDPDKCVGCGQCYSKCTRGAIEKVDDCDW